MDCVPSLQIQGDAQTLQALMLVPASLTQVPLRGIPTSCSAPARSRCPQTPVVEWQEPGLCSCPDWVGCTHSLGNPGRLTWLLGPRLSYSRGNRGAVRLKRLNEVKDPSRVLMVGCLQTGNYKRNKNKKPSCFFSAKPSVTLPSKIDHSLSI